MIFGISDECVTNTNTDVNTNNGEDAARREPSQCIAFDEIELFYLDAKLEKDCRNRSALEIRSVTA